MTPPSKPIVKPRKVLERKMMTLSNVGLDANVERRERRQKMAESARKKALSKHSQSPVIAKPTLTPTLNPPQHQEDCGQSEQTIASQPKACDSKQTSNCHTESPGEIFQENCCIPGPEETDTVGPLPSLSFTSVSRSDSATGQEIIVADPTIGSGHQNTEIFIETKFIALHEDPGLPSQPLQVPSLPSIIPCNSSNQDCEANTSSIHPSNNSIFVNSEPLSGLERCDLQAKNTELNSQKLDCEIQVSEESSKQDRLSQSPPVPKSSKTPPTLKDATDLRIGRILDYLNVANLDIAKSDKSSVSPAFDTVKKRLISLEVESEEKSRTIAALKHQLQDSRSTTIRQAEEHSKDLKSQLTLQRKEYEATIKRHLNFIDKTLAEKEKLVTQCTDLASQVKSIEAGVKSKLANLSEKHERDMKGAKSIWETGEKIKRDKWMVTQSAKIKEQTIKGLEPEIQRMIASHKTQLSIAEEKCRAQWVAERSELMRSHEQQISTMRDQWVSERTRALDEERDAARSRYAKQLERDEMEFSQSKRKWAAEMSEMRDQLMAQFRDEHRNEENAHRKQLDDLRSLIDQERDSNLRLVDDLRRRHAHDLSLAREKAQAEREAWQSAYQAKIESEIKIREREFKESLICERDREIERVISRLEQESGISNEDLVVQHRSEIDQLRSRHVEELKTVQDQWTVAMDKLVSLGREVEAKESIRRDLEREVWSLKSTFEAKDRTLDEVKRELVHYKSGEADIRKVVEVSFHTELQRQKQLITALKDECDRLKGQLLQSEQNADHRLALVEQEKSETISMLESRVKSTMASKDKTLFSMRDQLEDMKTRNGQLEILLERQRKELLLM